MNKLNFSNKYYLLNLIFLLERTAWFILIIQIPIFIAQKNVGGLDFTQETKGFIYLYWVLLQNSLPLITGKLIDNTKKKKFLIFASCIILFFAFLSIGSYQNLFGLLLGITLVSVGVSVFNPLVKGQIGLQIEKKNSSIGWGLHFWIYNFAIFVFGVPYSNYLRGISWEHVFVGAGLLYLLAFIITFFYKPEYVEKIQKTNLLDNLRGSIDVFKKDYNYILLISMSGFAVIFMQFYETLPNFIYDWSDTTQIVNNLNLSNVFTSDTWAGSGISFEWLYNINTGLTLLLLLPFSLFLKKYHTISSLLVGVLLAVVGFGLSIVSQNGIYLIGGFTIYTIGELITNPKFTEYFDFISIANQKSTHMGLLFISNLIGYPLGAVLGGYMYGSFGEKSSLAQKYLLENYNIHSSLNESFSTLVTKMNINEIELTRLLWTNYNPMIAFVPFLIIGLISVVGIIIFKSKINRSR